MNYYSHHIGDFDRATRHLTRIERSVYRDLLDVYYDTEAALNLDISALCRKVIARTSEEATAVEQVLNEFFIETPAGWYHDRCEEELEAYRTSTSQKSAAGRASAAKRAAKRQQALDGNSTGVEQPSNECGTALQLTSNHEPLTSNHEPDTSTTSPSCDDVRQCPTGTLINIFHECMPMNPRVKVVNAARKSAIRARWLEAAKLDFAPFGYSTKSQGIEAWRQFFTICAESKFLTGLSPPSAGKPAFVATIDWLMAPLNFAKCLEDRYHRDVP